MEIDSFIANFDGGARPNRYRVILNFPFESSGGINISGTIGAIAGPISIGTGFNAGSPSQKFSFMCKAAAIPESALGSINIPYQGRDFKVAGDRTFTDWNVTVLNEENFSIRNAFERWMDRINSHRGNVRTPTTNSYFADAEVYQLSTTGAILKKYKFHSMFPTNLSEISLGFDQNDSVEEFSAVLSYAYWTSDTTS